MKIGILTFHRCINYGSYWQARCLVEALQKRGHDTVILDHQSGRVNFAEWKCALQPVLPTEVPKSDISLYKQKIRKFFKLFDEFPLSPPFSLDDPSQMDEFDLVIVGSDEVWNLAHPWYGYCPLFYGEGVRAKRLISYAASFGNYDASWKLESSWAEKLHNFERISVRDENSRTIIRDSLGIEPVMALDPCLQFPETYMHYEKAFGIEPYVAVYGHNFSPFFIRNVKKWSKERELPLVSIGYRNEWADEQLLTADPVEFAAFMAKAEAVVTNFFHGCVFALVNSRPFVCETTQYRSNKVQGLIQKVGGEKHLVMENSAFEIYSLMLSEPIDSRVHRNINILRKESEEYLDLSLVNTFNYERV